MILTLTNVTEEPETIATPDGSFRDALHPQMPFEFREEAQVVIIGDKPDVRTQITQGLQTVGKVARQLQELIAGRKANYAQRMGEPEPVRVMIENHGTNAVRVILGDGKTDRTVAPGTAQQCDAPGYLELRELGRLNKSQVDGGRQPAVA